MASINNPTTRILIVLDIVAQHGPAPLKVISARCAFSRAAVWRALNSLRDSGWVFMRPGDNAFCITQACAERFASARAISEVDEQAAHLIEALSKQFDADVCLGGFGKSYSYFVRVSTDKLDYARQDFSLVTEPSLLAAQLGLDPIERVQATRAFLSFCNTSDRRYIEAGKHATQLRKLEKLGYYLAEDQTELALPVTLRKAKGYSLRLQFKSHRTMFTDSTIDALTEALDDKFVRRYSSALQ